MTKPTEPNPYAASALSAARDGGGGSFDRPTGVRWRILLLLMLFAALFHFNRISISVAGSERLMSEFSLSETQMGFVYSSYLIVYTICMIPGGWVIDRFGPKRALLIVGFGSVLLVPMAALAKHVPSKTGIDLTLPWLDEAVWMSWVLIVLCVIRGFVGMISAPFHPAAARATSFWQPRAFRTTANGLITGAAVLGIASTYVVFGFMMDKLGWPMAFVASAAVTLLLATLWAVYAVDDPRKHAGANEAECSLIEGREASRKIGKEAPAKAAPRESVLALFLSRSLIMVTLSYAAYSYFQYLFFYWVQYYYDKQLHFDKEDSRTYATITTLTMAVGMVAGGIAADLLRKRWGFRGLMIPPMVGMIAAGVLLLVGISVKEPLAVVGCFALATGALGLAEAPFWMTGIEVGKRRGGLSGAILNAGGNFGGLLAPIVTPWIAGEDDWQTGLMLAGVVCIVGALMWLGISLPKQSEAAG